MVEVRDAVLDLRLDVKGDPSPHSLRGGLSCSCYQLLVTTKDTKSWCASKFAGDFGNLL